MQDTYSSEDDCLPGGTLMGTFSGDTMTGMAMDTTSMTTAAP
jgi:hypothetical protein